MGATQTETTVDQTQTVTEAVRAEVAPMFDTLRAFVDRRIAELSMEIHATVQLAEFSESNLSGQLGRMQEQIANLIAMPNTATRNSGMELEAVVQATETAANRIMEAAEAIGDWLRTGARDTASVEAVAERVNAIFEACSFQDITSQRIRRAIEHLQQVETMLTDLAPVGSEAMEETMEAAMVANPDLAQDDVDRMFG
jgi:chemotaxis protein CheZ